LRQILASARISGRREYRPTNSYTGAARPLADSPDFVQRLNRPESDGPDLSAQLGADEERRIHLAAEHAAGEIEYDEWKAARAVLTARIESARPEWPDLPARRRWRAYSNRSASRPFGASRRTATANRGPLASEPAEDNRGRVGMISGGPTVA
jgi:hypothetical protein